MSSANPFTRLSALALSAVTLFAGAGLAEPEATGQARMGQAPPAAQLVPLDSGSRLTGPRRPFQPPGASQLVPTGVPPEVERLGRKVLESAAPESHFPVAGPFNWGQEGARFGAGRGGRAHAGQDVFSRTGTPLRAVRDGVVLEEGDGGGRGNYVAIHDPPARRTYVYLHMRRRALVRRRELVRSGQRVGEVGCSGSCFGDHLHFEIRHGRGADGRPLDPLPDLLRWARGSGARPTLPPGAH